MAYRNKKESFSAGPPKQAQPEPVSNLLDVYRAIEADAVLDANAKKHMLSDLKVAAAVVGLPLNALTVTVRDLRPILERAPYRKHGLSRSRWNNIRSTLARAMRLVGIDVRVRHRLPMSAAWQDTLTPLPVKPHRMSIVPFARWCNSLDILPSEVTQEVSDQYLHMMEDTDLRLGRREAYCRFVRMWNRAHEHSSDWPDLRLTIISRRDWYAQPLSAFPQSFQDDVAAMLEDAQSPLTKTRPQRVRAVTAQGYLARIRGMTSALVAAGWEPSQIRSIADLVEVNAARAILDFMIKRHGVEKGGLPFADAVLLCTLAKLWVRVPEAQLLVLKEFPRKLRLMRTGMTTKNQRTIDHFDDDRMILRFLELPDKLFSRYHKQVDESYTACISVQIALAIKILIHAPVRAKNLSAIELGDNLIVYGRGRSRRVHLHFDAEDVKNNLSLDFELPSDTLSFLDFYLARVRPRITSATSTCLFPNNAGEPKVPGSFSQQIAGRVTEELGVRVTAHQFRHLVGYIYLRANPGAIEVVRQLLGDKGLEVITNHYTGLERKQALEHYDRFVINKRDELRGRRKPRRKNKGTRS